MPIIRKTLKYGIPVGVTYYTISQKLWSPMTDRDVYDKVDAINRCAQQSVDKFGQIVNVNIREKIKFEPLGPSMDVKNLWNCCVKTTFNTLYTIDCQSIKQLFTRLTKSIT